MSLEEIFTIAESHAREGISELHIVGGLNPRLPYSYYLDMLRGLKQRLPDVHLQAFTMVEIDHIAATAGQSVHDTLRDLQAAGLGSIPGGGAEVFSPGVREQLCEKKISGQRWLEIARTAHELGIRSNATMLYGHVESVEERVEHLIQLRELQDQTGGFLAFIPLAFHPENTRVEQGAGTTGYDDLKNLAVARLMLDNFPHQGVLDRGGTQDRPGALSFGVDDIDGTVIEEQITHSAGARTAQGMTRTELVISSVRPAGYPWSGTRCIMSGAGTTDEETPMDVKIALIGAGNVGQAWRSCARSGNNWPAGTASPSNWSRYATAPTARHRRGGPEDQRDSAHSRRRPRPPRLPDDGPGPRQGVGSAGVPGTEPADVVLECTHSNLQTGSPPPATSARRWGCASMWSPATRPAALNYQELRDLAKTNGVRYLFGASGDERHATGEPPAQRLSRRRGAGDPRPRQRDHEFRPVPDGEGQAG